MKIAKSNTLWILLFLCVIIISVLSLFIIKQNKDNSVVKIYRDNSLIKTLNLPQNQTVKIDCDEDNYNEVTVKNGKVKMSYSTCKNQICVNHGEITDATLPIVCVPNHLVVTIESSDDKADTVVGG